LHEGQTVRRLPSLKALPAFEISADRLSFSAAADQLRLTHGAISRQIRTLEDQLGVPLFRRFNRRIELTEAGAVFLPSVRQALQLLETASAQVVDQTKSGPLVVSCLATFMMRWLIPRLYRFNAAHPDIEVRLSASHAPVHFEEGGIDVAIRLGRAPWPRGCLGQPFLADRIGPVLSPALLDKRPLRRPSDLKKLPLLHAETRPRAWQHWLKATRTQGLDAAAGTRLEHTYFLLEAAASGLGVAIGSVALVEQDLQAGRLVAPFGFIADRNAYCLLRPAGQPAKGGQITAFVDWVRKEAQRPAVAVAPGHVSSAP
jgi:LysR family transcriptional regulator, glycine cleavage system transcriptional activator